MKYTPRWKQILFAIFYPSYWVTIGTYSKARDRKVQRLIAEHKFEYSNCVSTSSGVPFDVTFDTGDTMWIGCTNFASGKMCKENGWTYDDIIPSRHTMYLIKKNIVDKYEEG